VFDIGWQELMVIGIVAVVVIGPKDLPRVLRTVTMAMRKVRSMARDFQDSIDELAREAELHELRKDIEQAADADIEKELRTIADPAREVEESVREIGQSLEERAALEPAKPAENEMPATPAENDVPPTPAESETPASPEAEPATPPAAEAPVPTEPAPAASAKKTRAKKAGGKKAGDAP
jgi:sec-independent protein translocase protein TatB